MGCCGDWCGGKQNDKDNEIDLEQKKQTGYLVTNEDKEYWKGFLGLNGIKNKDMIMPEIKVKLGKLTIFVSIQYAEDVKDAMSIWNVGYKTNVKGCLQPDEEAFKKEFKLIGPKNENSLYYKPEEIIVKTNDLDEKYRDLPYIIGYSPSDILKKLTEALKSEEVKNFINLKQNNNNNSEKNLDNLGNNLNVGN